MTAHSLLFHPNPQSVFSATITGVNDNRKAETYEVRFKEEGMYATVPATSMKKK